jgi:hypothetical protein
MFDEIIIKWQDIVYSLAFMVSIPYLASLLARYLSDRFGTSIEEENLAFVAEQLNCSAYKVFCVSGARWNIGRERIDCDFKEYLRSLTIPYYVRGFTADVIATLDSNDNGS